MGSLGQFRRARRTRQATRIAIIAGALLSQLVAPQSAGAALATCGTGGNYHVGQKRPSTGVTAYGVKATLNAERGSLCGSDLTHNNFNTVYVMLAEEANDDPDHIFGWAQVGYHRFAGETTYHFWQHRHGNPPPGDLTADIQTEFYEAAVANSATYEYVVRYSDTCDCIRMFIDGVLVKNTDFDPFVSWAGSGAWNYQLMAEARYKESDVPGTASDRTNLSGIKLWSSVNTYYAVPCGSLTSHNDSSRWATTRPTCDSAQIWTP